MKAKTQIQRIGRRVGLSLPILRPVLKKKERLAAEAKRLLAERERLATEAERLLAEKERVATEAERLLTEKERLATEAERLATETERLLTEKERLATEKEHRVAEAERLLAEVARVTEEREALELQLYQLGRVQQQQAETAIPGPDVEALYAKLAAAMEIYYAKLAGRLTMSSSEISSGLRVALPRRRTKRCGDSQRYLDLLENALTGQLFEDPPISPWSNRYDPSVRAIGRDWPGKAPTMIGAARMRNIRELAERVIDEGLPGDFLEAGVWRGGACIYMRAILAAWGEADRLVWVADSFAGLPLPDPDTYPADAGDPHHTFDQLIVQLDEVKDNFARYGLLDEQVRFLPGWFADTLPQAPIEQLALLRLDGDMYSSTIQTLEALYDKVTPGGYIIIDDYILKGCRQATDDFRARRGISEAIQDIDGAGVYWQKAHFSPNAAR